MILVFINTFHAGKSFIIQEKSKDISLRPRTLLCTLPTNNARTWANDLRSSFLFFNRASVHEVWGGRNVLHLLCVYSPAIAAASRGYVLGGVIAECWRRCLDGERERKRITISLLMDEYPFMDKWHTPNHLSRDTSTTNNKYDSLSKNSNTQTCHFPSFLNKPYST